MREKKSFKRIFTDAAFLSFIIPILITALAFGGVGIYPGSRTILLTYDLKAELLELYGYLSNPGPGYDTMFHSMSGGLGGGFYGTAALYLSPFDLIYSFIPVKYLPDAIYYMVLTKIGLCGLCCSLLLAKNSKFKIPKLITIVLSCCYALMSYNFMYFMSPMWYDVIIFLPLIALCLEDVIEGKFSCRFIILTSLCIICDYYIAYMCIIGVTLYFFFRLIEENLGLKTSVKLFLSYSLHGLISGGISAFVIIPAVLDFNRGKLSEESVVTSGEFIKNSLADVLMSFKPQSYAGVGFNASPNIYCGSIVLLLVVFWLTYGKKEIRARITAVLIISFYFLSFIFGPLDRAWHGFREPLCFSVRYAFTFVFIMVNFAARGCKRLAGITMKKTSKTISFLFSTVVIYTAFELYLNGSFILAGIGTECGYSPRSEYNKICDVQKNLIPYNELDTLDGYGRIISDYKYSNGDGALFGYDGLARFSSSYNYNVSSFFRSMGLNVIYHSLGEKGMTPPLASLINGRYITSYWVDISDCYEPVTNYKCYTLYKNSNVLPLAFEVNSSCINSNSEFAENPFENINTVYNELFDKEDIYPDIFLTEEPEVKDSPYELSFTANYSGRHFMFVEYKYDDEFETDNEELAQEFAHRKIIRHYILEGISSGDYGNNQYSYCVDLGVLEAGENYELSLETSASESSDVYIYYYDADAFKNIQSSVNGVLLKEINGRGIELVSDTSDASSIFISLPSEDGYTVYVDGKKTEINSYRDCFMIIPVEAGKHVIRLFYLAPGFICGVIVFIISVSIMLCIKFFDINLYLQKND